MDYNFCTSTPRTEIALRFCSCCLKKFAPDPSVMDTSIIRFFVPTIDVLYRHHFAYIEISRERLKAIYQSREPLSINLEEVADGEFSNLVNLCDTTLSFRR